MCPGTNKDITFATLQTLQTIVQSVSYDETVCDNILVKVFETILGPLADVNARLFTPATAIAFSCARASNYAAITVSNKVLPLFLTQIEINCEKTTQRSTLLELMTQLIVICSTKHVLNQLDGDNLTGIQRELILCLSEDEELLKVALNSLTNVADIMSLENRQNVYSTINQHLHTQLLAYVEPVLFAFAKKYPNEVMEKIIKTLLIRDQLNADNAGYTIETICSLVSISDFTVAALTFTFENIFDTKDSHIQIVALTNLRQLLENNLDDLLLADLYKNYQLIDKFFNFVNSNVTLNSCILVQISDILRLMVKSLDVKEQTIVIEKYLPKMDLQRTDHLYLTAGILGYLDEAIQLDHFERIVNELTKLSMSSDDEQIHQICNHLLCSMFNKMPDDEKHNSILRRVIGYLETEIHKNHKKAVAVVSWISKGLLARGHSDAAELINTVNHFCFFELV